MTTYATPIPGIPQPVMQAGAALLQLRMPTVTRPIDDAKMAEIRGLLEPGDIVLLADNESPTLELLTKAILNSDYMHSFMYEGDGKFIESTVTGLGGEGTVRNDLEVMHHKPLLLEIIRPPYASEEDRQASVQYCRDHLGAPYDYRFDLEDDQALYCTELLYHALKAGPHPMDVPRVKIMGYEGVNLDAFRQMPGAKVVYSDHSNFWRNAASRFPVALGACIGGVTAAAAVGARATFAGSLVGLAISTLAGHVAIKMRDKARESNPPPSANPPS